LKWIKNEYFLKVFAEKIFLIRLLVGNLRIPSYLLFIFKVEYFEMKDFGVEFEKMIEMDQK
jgi:hypothetical protein